MVDFSVASFASTESVERAHDDSFRTIVLFCCAGLLAWLCLTTVGIDVSAGWV
jgi:hypothetical protein